jgi:hypothetical protein
MTRSAVPRSGDALGSWRPRARRVCRLYQPMGRFETEWLTRPENLIALADLPGRWIDKVHMRRPPRIIVLDMDSSESPTHREQEGSAYNGHFGCTCVLQGKIGHLLKRPVGRPPHEVRRYYASFSYQAQSWKKPRRVVAKVEWHPGELYPRFGFIVTNLARPAERVVAFYNQRGTAEQWIKEGKGAIKWTRLSCRSFAANALRLQLHALAYNLGNFMRTLAMPKAVAQWSLTSLREKLIKIGAKVVSHGRYVTFQLAEVAVPRQMFQQILSLIARLRAPARA